MTAFVCRCMEDICRRFKQNSLLVSYIYIVHMYVLFVVRVIVLSIFGVSIYNKHANLTNIARAAGSRRSRTRALPNFSPPPSAPNA
jgi:hypothetical protein